MNDLQRLVAATYAYCEHFNLPTPRDCCDFISEELTELRRAGAHAGAIPMDAEYLRAHPMDVLSAHGEVRKEYGDLLFMVLALGNILGLDAEDVVKSTSDKFTKRNADARD